MLVGYVTNWVALWMIYEPAEPRKWGRCALHGLFIRRQHDVAGVYARIVADEILTVSEFGSELLTGPQSDRTRALIERSMRPAIDRATGPARAAVQVAIGAQEYESIRQLVRRRARRPHDGAAHRPGVQPQPERGDA